MAFSVCSGLSAVFGSALFAQSSQTGQPPMFRGSGRSIALEQQPLEIRGSGRAVAIETDRGSGRVMAALMDDRGSGRLQELTPVDLVELAFRGSGRVYPEQLSEWTGSLV
ncbi:MAG: hypothetical protein AAGF66_20490 [Cyanobacteria bacterium P01_H01_bin.119]